MPNGISGKAADNLSKVFGGSIEKMLSPDGEETVVGQVPLGVEVSVEVATGGFLWVAAVSLSQIISQIIVFAHYYAHGNDVYKRGCTLGGVGIRKKR